MRSTQHPHIVDVHGVLSYTTASAPAPLISPLNGDFVAQTERIATSLNKIHQRRIVVERFENLAELVELLQALIERCEPYQFQV